MTYLPWALVAALVLTLLFLVTRLRAAKAQATAAQSQFDQEHASFAKRLEQAEAKLAADHERRLTEELRSHRKQLDESLANDRAEIQRDRAKLDRREESLQAREEKFQNRQLALDDKSAALDRRDAKLSSREHELESWNEQLKAREADLAQQQDKISTELSRIAGLTQQEARDELLAALDQQLLNEQGDLIRKRLAVVEERAKEQAVEVISRAIQRYAAEHTAETTISKIELPDEEMKGRIIGKEGRNIRAFEQISGVDLIIDDSPNLITLSCFDGVRREIARRALAELIQDGRIHPARIEEVFLRCQQEMDREVVKLGEEAAYECDVSGLHPQVVKLLGKLQYRTSYGQNVLQHTKEVAFLCGAMAGDMGLDAALGRRCGLLHDVGKAIDHEQEGSHPVLGYEALKRFGENEIVANAALAHHEGFEVLSPYTTLAAAADAISAARPGARRENVERYIKRLQQLEDIALGQHGVMKAYAVQAGRELRVIVNGHHLDDAALTKVARDIARSIEDQVTYPGEVKVTMIRETRATAVAR